MKIENFLLKNAIVAACFLAVSCATVRQEAQVEYSVEVPTVVSRSIIGKPTKSARELEAFFLMNNSDIPLQDLREITECYIEECAIEGINSDVAFCQMCLETGYLRFGNLVTKDMHNYCGLGAIDADNKGCVFATVRQGVRAHVQHLHAYATVDAVLTQELIDPRYKYVLPRGKAQDVFALSGTWAADREYGAKLDRLLSLLSTIVASD